eukprot:15323-Heterococcus_DN1.PRE.1
MALPRMASRKYLTRVSQLRSLRLLLLQHTFNATPVLRAAASVYIDTSTSSSSSQLASSYVQGMPSGTAHEVEPTPKHPQHEVLNSMFQFIGVGDHYYVAGVCREWQRHIHCIPQAAVEKRNQLFKAAHANGCACTCNELPAVAAAVAAVAVA